MTCLITAQDPNPGQTWAATPTTSTALTALTTLTASTASAWTTSGPIMVYCRETGCLKKIPMARFGGNAYCSEHVRSLISLRLFHSYPISSFPLPVKLTCHAKLTFSPDTLCITRLYRPCQCQFQSLVRCSRMYSFPITNTRQLVNNFQGTPYAYPQRKPLHTRAAV